MPTRDRCPECFSEEIEEEEYEELHGKETVDVCQKCNCRFWEHNVQSHGNTRAGKAMFICDMLTGQVSIGWLKDRIDEYDKMRYT